MKQLNLIGFLAILLLSFACNSPKDKIQIKGEITGLKQAEFFVYSEEGILQNIDTISIRDGKFNYEHTLTEPAILTFLYPNFSRTYLVAEPGDVIKVKGEASKLGEIDISGSKENELLTKFRKQNAGKSAKEKSMTAAQFVNDHPDKIAAVAVFKRYFSHEQQLDGAIALPLLEKLKEKQPNLSAVKIIDMYLNAILQCSNDKKLPNFTAITIEGDTINSTQFKGKPLFIVFWAPWHNEGYRVIKNVAELEKKYKEKLQILTISVDYNQNSAKVRMNQENITAPAICDEKAFSSPLVKTLGLRYLPGNLLINANGEIEKRDIPTKDMLKTLEKWLNKQPNP
ncbi:antioxidant, AhpC/TSA family [gut metagenome]|uniref:Antioxidant, AhpC/TSA family n=1 Tax=gut metagenome TaxID=749906 RepID=J9H673_9ZZZZ